MRKIYLGIIVLMLAFTFGAFFKTGCSKDAEAANVMFKNTYSFTIIDDIIVSAISPTPGSNLQATNSPIIFDVKHSQPITTVALVVRANGTEISGSLVSTNVAGGKHIEWIADANYPTLATIEWDVFVDVETP